jgi:hypothetical protein
MRNTKKYRKEIYSKMLEYITTATEKDKKFFREGYYDTGLCFAIRRITNIYEENLDLSSKKCILKELLEYAPKECPHKDGFWFELDLEGAKKRINILKRVIKEMK